MSRLGKFFLAASLIKRMGIENAIAIVKTIANIDFEVNTAEGIVDEINGLPPEKREKIVREFRNIHTISRAPKVKPTIIEIMRRGGKLSKENDNEYYLDQMNHIDLARTAAFLFLTVDTQMWRDICTMARHFSVAESYWLTFELETGDDFKLHTNDDTLAALRKKVCSFIFKNEGRADEGWCSVYHDEASDEYSCTIDMTDHLQNKKERIERNTFRMVSKKDVFDVLFRYKPSLKELSIRAEGPRAYRKEMCEYWVQTIAAGNARLKDLKQKYYLDKVLTMPSELAVPGGTPIRAATIAGIEIAYASNESQRIAFRDLGEYTLKMIGAMAKAAKIPLFAFKVTKIEIDFAYLAGDKHIEHDRRFFRAHDSNVVRAPDLIKLFIHSLLVANKLTHE